MYILFLLTTCIITNNAGSWGEEQMESIFFHFPSLLAPPNFVHCMRKRVQLDRPRESVKGKKGHKSKDLRQKEGHT